MFARRHISISLLLLAAVSPVLADEATKAVSKPTLRRIEAIEPQEVQESVAGKLTIQGKGFEQGIKVRVGQVFVDGPEVSADRVTVRVPGGLVPGGHSVRVEWPDGRQLCSRWPLSVRERSCQVARIPFQKSESTLDGSKAAPEASSALQDSLSCLARTGPQNLLVLGFASREGTEQNNKELSRKRAAAVAGVLRTNLPQLRVTELGLGESLPLSLGDQEETLSRNRRALILSSDAKPCQAIRLSLDGSGKPTELSRAILQSTIRCYANRTVTSALLLGDPKGGPSEEQARALATQIEREIKNASGGLQTSVQPVFGTSAERKELAKLYELSTRDADGSFVELYPLAWSNAPNSRVMDVDVGCPYEHVPPVISSGGTTQVIHYETPQLQKDATGFAGVSVGSLRAFGQTHIGAEVHLGTVLVRNDKGTVRLLAKGTTSGYFSERPYQIAEGFSSHLLARATLGPSFDVKVSSLRLEVGAAPGIVLPASRSTLLQGELIMGWAVSSSAEFTVGARAGTFFFRGGETAPLTQLQVGGDWWF